MTLPPSGDVAIVGMGCLFAGAPDLDTYWKNILSKFDAISDPPSGEWDPKIFYDPESQSNDRVYCKRGGYISDLTDFRPLDFGVMPITVDGGEPDQWLALRVAREALLDAGYPESPGEHQRTEVVLGKGTYINRGNMTVGYHAMVLDHFLLAVKNLRPEYTDAELREIKDELKAALPPFSADTAPALIGNIIAGRIANRLDLMGPSFTVDAACASALLAIDIGVRDLLSHKYDLVLAGGANVNAPLPTMSLFCQLGALSRKEQIRPFDKMADGTILGEGMGMIVLKRREDAERDGNRIYALIKGVGVASDGRALHVMAPRVEGEELALRRAFEMAGCEPQTVGLIEAHGTATPVGDATEIQALRKVFGDRQSSLPSCAIGSVKSMIGHTMPAAGIAGVIKTALSLYHRVVPPTLNCDEPNPALELEKTPFYVNTEARPWIHGAETPRRAGVNSFGFGGINAHVLLEEHPAEKSGERSHMLHWETEVCIVEAASRQQLIERVNQLIGFLNRSPGPPLKDLAYSLNTRLTGQPCRISVIASTCDDLAHKLKLAATRLGDVKIRQIKDNAGIFYFEQALAGKLAFLFPGEGAQYPNMLLELCLHFPEVRQCFDQADRALARGSRSVMPSDFIFPRTILPEAEREAMEKALWQIDGAVEGVLIANWAMWTFLNHLKIQPDLIAGHSTGDYSAMVASNMIRLDEMILEWNSVHARLDSEGLVGKATLLAIASDVATVTAIIGAIDGELYLAMANCPHQTVLAGNQSAIENVTEELRRRAIIYEVLPFDRPYHTPMFQAYAEALGTDFFGRITVREANTEIYSCTTAAPYPVEIEEIRKLFVAHWVRPVLFTDTVNRMYEEGARLFVEAGPRGNLTAFVSDILRGRPHLAMPANVHRRSALTQVNHLVGVLAAQGVGMQLDYLYARRSPQFISWEDAESRQPAKQPAAMKLCLALPPLKIAPRKEASKKEAPRKIQAEKPAVETAVPASNTRQDAEPRAPGPVTMVAHQNHQKTHHNGSTAHEMPLRQNHRPEHQQPAPAPAMSRPAAAAQAPLVMQEYFKGMDVFLDVESQVMEAFLNRARGKQEAVAPAAPAPVFPLLGTITALLPSQELTAMRRLDLKEDLFLRDHALGGTISVTSPDLRPLMVLPLTMSMEILAEAGAALLPHQVLAGMRDIQAHHWIQVDDTPVDLKIVARKSTESPHEVFVQIWNVTDALGQASSKPIVEGTTIFASAYSERPLSSAPLLEEDRPSTLASAELYDGRLMFHGPCFQGVLSVERSGRNGVAGQLLTLPVENMFRSNAAPRFVTDPIVLDAAGQLVGFWAAEHLKRGFVVFPYHLKSLEVYGANRPEGERLTCGVNLQLEGNQGIRSDIEIALPDGTVWMRLKGWADRRFDPPPHFHAAWTAPHSNSTSQSWETPLAAIPNGASLKCHRLGSVFEPGAGFWKDLWSSLVLNRRERRTFRELAGPERRHMDWLSGRTAAKDAIRSFLREHYGLKLLPADIEITQDEFGRPVAGGSWTQHVPAIPEFSIAHCDGLAVALVGDGVYGQQVGIDVEKIRELEPGFQGLVLNGQEQSLLDAVPQTIRAEWLLRLWCVKEAISKALGRGLMEGPGSIQITTLDPRTGLVNATPVGKLADAVPGPAGRTIQSYTVREGAYVAAIALYGKKS